MNSRTKAVFSAAAALTVVGSGLTLSVIAPADAASTTGCGGKRVATYYLNSKTGNALGEGRLYRNRHGGYCAMTVHTGSFVGKPTATDVSITGDTSAQDDGIYSRQAGPVRAKGACVNVRFSMRNKKGNHGATIEVQNAGCSSAYVVGNINW